MKFLVADGYLAAGYNYVNMDDCWPEKERTTDGKIIANRTRFPSGMEGLAKYVWFHFFYPLGDIVRIDE